MGILNKEPGLGSIIRYCGSSPDGKGVGMTITIDHKRSRDELRRLFSYKRSEAIKLYCRNDYGTNREYSDIKLKRIFKEYLSTTDLEDFSPQNLISYFRNNGILVDILACRRVPMYKNVMKIKFFNKSPGSRKYKFFAAIDICIKEPAISWVLDSFKLCHFSKWTFNITKSYDEDVCRYCIAQL